MARLFKKSGRKPGQAPGSIIHIGEINNVSKIQVINFDKEDLYENEIKKVEECFPFFEKSNVSWIDIVGLHQIDVIEKIGKQLKIHPLVLEDIANTYQHPKVEDYENYFFIVMKMFRFDQIERELKIEHISVLCGSNFVISFFDKESDVFEPIRIRIREGRKTLRESNSDYLMYALLDAVVDNYFMVLENIGENIEHLEKNILQNPKSSNLTSLHKLQDDILIIQKSILPLRRLIPTIEHSTSPLISKTTRIYLKDVNDHLTQIGDTIDATNNKFSAMNNLYLSVLGQKTNQAMKILSLIATIFIPMTFLAGVYGMNFQFMPELSSPIAYPIVLASMTGIGLSMIAYFKKKKLW